MRKDIFALCLRYPRRQSVKDNRPRQRRRSVRLSTSERMPAGGPERTHAPEDTTGRAGRLLSLRQRPEDGGVPSPAPRRGGGLPLPSQPLKSAQPFLLLAFAEFEWDMTAGHTRGPLPSPGTVVAKGSFARFRPVFSAPFSTLSKNAYTKFSAMPSLEQTIYKYFFSPILKISFTTSVSFLSSSNPIFRNALSKSRSIK